MTTCTSCIAAAQEWAVDNLIDHLGIRIPAAEAAGLGYNMRRDLTPEEWAKAARWAEAWLTEGLVASVGSDCGGHAAVAA